MAMFGDNGCLLDRCFEQLQLENQGVLPAWGSCRYNLNAVESDSVVRSHGSLRMLWALK